MTSLNGQEVQKLVFNPLEIEPVVNHLSDTMTSDVLFQRTREFLNEYYNDPELLVEGSVESKMIRYSATEANGWQANSVLGIPFNNDFDYQVIIRFKDGRYRFEFRITELYWDGEVYPYDMTFWYKKKDGSLKKSMEGVPEQFELVMNDILQDLHNYLNGATTKKLDDW